MPFFLLELVFSASSAGRSGGIQEILTEKDTKEQPLLYQQMKPQDFPVPSGTFLNWHSRQHTFETASHRASCESALCDVEPALTQSCSVHRPEGSDKVHLCIHLKNSQLGLVWWYFPGRNEISLGRKSYQNNKRKTPTCKMESNDGLQNQSFCKTKNDNSPSWR